MCFIDTFSAPVHTGREPLPTLYCPLCLFIACSDLSSTLVSCSFTFYSVYVSFPSAVTDFSLDVFPCVRVPLESYFTSFCLLEFLFYFFLSLSEDRYLNFLSPSVALSYLSCFLASPILYVCSYSSFLYFHPALPFLCLSACRCRMCAATFFSKSDMQIHSKSHTEAKPHKCPHCAKSFANSSYLAQHIRIHSGAKPYTCSYCQKSFRQLSHLQQHTRYCSSPQPPSRFYQSAFHIPCPLNLSCQVPFRCPDSCLVPHRKERPCSDFTLISILSDPVDSCKNYISHLALECNSHVRLKLPLVIGSHIPTLYANKHFHYNCRFKPGGCRSALPVLHLL